MPLIFQVPQAHTIVIERFGKYKRTMSAGLRVRLPVIDKPKDLRQWGGIGAKMYNGQMILVELSEQMTDTKSRNAITNDNVQLAVDAVVYWQIVHPERAVYEIDNLPKAIDDLALTSLRSIIGTMQFDEAIQNRAQINDGTLTELSSVVERWGVQVNRVEIQELKPSDEAASAMLRQMSAERERRAVEIEAEGKAKARIMVAEAEAKAITAVATAEAQYLELLKTQVGGELAGRLLLASKLLQNYAQITENPAHKVFLPNTFHGLIDLDKNPKEEA
jgi:regulator of protease activity HflC (stomatin/prohibitin superfamily)